jgi:diguanylate cyclase (GGDEF)-like protein
MSADPESASFDLKRRAARYFQHAIDDLSRQVDRMFAWLLAAEWIGMVATGLVVEPRVWNGGESSIHPHLLAAILSGPLFIFPAIAMAIYYPSLRLTRHMIAAAQIVVSGVAIDVTGGRIETHFHIFGSLAFLAFYRDWRVLATASVLTAADHFARGIWWPKSAYGVLTISPWRWAEHTWWVVFEDFFLVLATKRSVNEMWAVATSKAHLHAGAYHDVLTGLANRRLLEERFDSHPGRERETKRAVLFIDLDRFKQANDTLGHGVGDKLLMLVARRLTAAVSRTDTIARVGGDEFVALLEEISGVEDALETGSQVLGVLATPFQVDGHELLLSASVGIALCPEHGTALSTLQERADRAMYVAKSQGRNQCAVFSSEVARREEVLNEIGRDLYQALSRGELLLYFQPLVERDAQLTGFEALLRWMHPVHGCMPPSDFIPMAERSGLIIPIGEWVLKEACRNCVKWQQNGPMPLGVAVNVSAVQIEQAGFADRVMEILKEAALEPSRLTLELTESILIQDTENTRRQLASLRRAGVRVALDDFGTGYSSLSYLVTLPADTIKLDRSFVNREFANAPAVIESIIQMAHRVGLRVVGEGVETTAQRDRLLDMNCDEMQGFYFSQPLPCGQVEEYIEAVQEREATLC